VREAAEEVQGPLSALAEALETAVRETDRNRRQTEELLTLACEVVAHSTQGAADVLDAAIRTHEDAGLYLTRARDAALAAV
jgi:molybdopterin-guanine dinucleotide biosynthesis protein A